MRSDLAGEKSSWQGLPSQGFPFFSSLIFHLIMFGSAFLSELIKTLSLGYGCMRAYRSISPFLGRKAHRSYDLTTKWDKTQGYLSASPSSYSLDLMQSKSGYAPRRGTAALSI